MTNPKLRVRCLLAAGLALMAMSTLPLAAWYWSTWR